jgi:gas vesicle protein
MRMRTELIAGMAAGAVIGAIAGLVLAPNSGESNSGNTKQPVWSDQGLYC